MNRLGHCLNYPFSIELETDIAEEAEKSSSLLTNQIYREPDHSKSLFHSDFDNYDQLLNNLTGSGSIHTAHGIMMQEVGGDLGILPEPATFPRTGKRSLDIIQPELPEVYVTARKSPVLTISQHVLPGSPDALLKSIKHQLLWVLARKKYSVPQAIPSWSGFVSQSGSLPKQLTTIAYYPVIPNPITEYKTVAECLRYAEEATNEVGQKYVITTFDIGACMKAYPLVFNDPLKYKDHIVLIGSFHATMAYLKMIGKKMSGSGLDDILIEADLITSGSLKGVMSGKHFERSMHCHKVMFECLERLLLEQFMIVREGSDWYSTLTEELLQKLDKLLKFSSPEIIETSLTNTSL